MNQREQRKKALEAAKQRLAFRRKQKEQLQLLRQQKQSGISTGFENQETRKNDYGKKLIDDTKEMIKDLTTKKEIEEQKLIDDEKNNQQLTENKKQIVPGPRADLNIVHNVNVVDLMKRSRVEYVKEIQTDSVEIGQHSNIITDQTNNEELNEILATFIENEINPWPNKKDQVYKRITIQKQENNHHDNDDDDDDDDMKQEEKTNMNNNEEKKDDEEEKEEELLVLSNDAATKLFKSSTFLSAFKKKAKFLDAALGINEEHSVFIEAHSTIRDIKENSSMEKLIKIGELSSSFTNGRPITCLDFDKNLSDRFLASYSGSMFKPMSISDSKSNDEDNSQKTSSEPAPSPSSSEQQQQALNIQSDGLINIFDIDQESNKYKIISSLECQSMINCAQFHPTKENMIIGASVSGQVLGWDISLNKKTPTIRTDFSSSSHTQPIFALKFLPSMLSYMPSSKIQQIITLSNDGKLCVWRDDMLYKPNYEFLLKLSKSNTTSSTATTSSTTTTTTTNQAKEITTTCFSHPKLFNENDNKLWFGSDEGCIYETNLNLNKNDERELSITSFISSAHYGPITCIDFYKCQSINSTEYNLQNGLYLTSSFDWTVKLWHISSSKSIALFNQMEDYVYDVEWSPIHPSIFAVVDGSGNLTIFNLNISFEHPASEPTNILLIDKEEHQIRPNMEQISITKLLWSPNGKQIIVGDSNGNISIFDLPVSDPVPADFDKFEEIIKRKLDSLNV